MVGARASMASCLTLMAVFNAAEPAAAQPGADATAVEDDDPPPEPSSDVVFPPSLLLNPVRGNDRIALRATRATWQPGPDNPQPTFNGEVTSTRLDLEAEITTASGLGAYALVPLLLTRFYRPRVVDETYTTVGNPELGGSALVRGPHGAAVLLRAGATFPVAAEVDDEIDGFTEEQMSLVVASGHSRPGDIVHAIPDAAYGRLSVSPFVRAGRAVARVDLAIDAPVHGEDSSRALPIIGTVTAALGGEFHGFTLLAELLTLVTSEDFVDDNRVLAPAENVRHWLSICAAFVDWHAQPFVGVQVPLDEQGRRDVPFAFHVGAHWVLARAAPARVTGVVATPPDALDAGVNLDRFSAANAAGVDIGVSRDDRATLRPPGGGSSAGRRDMLRTDLYGHVTAIGRLGGYAIVPAVHVREETTTSNQLSEQTWRLGNVEAGVLFHARRDPHRSWNLRGGVTLPTAPAPDLAEPGGQSWRATWPLRLTDMVHARGSTTSLRVSSSATVRAGHLALRLEGGLDLPVHAGSESPDAPLIRLNAGAGSIVGPAVVWAEIVNVLDEENSGGGDGISMEDSRWYHAFSVSARLTMWSVQPAVSFVVPIMEGAQPWVLVAGARALLPSW